MVFDIATGELDVAQHGSRRRGQRNHVLGGDEAGNLELAPVVVGTVDVGQCDRGINDCRCGIDRVLEIADGDEAGHHRLVVGRDHKNVGDGDIAVELRGTCSIVETGVANLHTDGAQATGRIVGGIVVGHPLQQGLVRGQRRKGLAVGGQGKDTGSTHVTDTETADDHVCGIGRQRELRATDGQDFVIAIHQTGQGHRHADQVGVVGIGQGSDGREADRRVGDVLPFIPGHRVAGAGAGTIEIDGRVVLRWGDGDRAVDRGRIERGGSAGVGHTLIVVAVVDDDGVAARRVGVIDGRVIAGALVAQRGKDGFDVGGSGTGGQRDDQRRTAGAARGCPAHAGQGAAIDEECVTGDAVGNGHCDGAGAEDAGSQGRGRGEVKVGQGAAGRQ